MSVKPGVRLEGVAWLTATEEIEVRTAAPPRDGEANLDVLRQMARVLGAPKSSLAIVAGHKSRQKVVALAAAPEDVVARLAMLKE